MYLDSRFSTVAHRILLEQMPDDEFKNPKQYGQVQGLAQPCTAFTVLAVCRDLCLIRALIP